MDRSRRITGARKALRDYQQYLKSPVPGTQIFPLESNINEFHVNTKVPGGTYRDLVIHWILTIPEEYPFKAPFGNLPPGTTLSRLTIHGTQFCNNYVQNFAHVHTEWNGSFDGWTPGCTFESLMLDMKCFFDDNNSYYGSYGKERARDQAVRIFEGYQCKSCGSQGEIFEENVATETETGLTCQVSHLSFKDDPKMILGYPINITFRSSKYNERDILKIRLPDIELFPEMISYESYTTALSFKLSGETRKMRTPLGLEYNYWIPIYLNDRHYNVSKKYIYKILPTICYGEEGSDYQPQMFMKVYPAILNGIVVAISKCKSYESDALILAFTNVLTTFLHAVRVENLERANSRVVERFIVQNRRSKRDTPNLGEWLFNLAANGRFKLKNSVPIVLKEMFPRLCFWINKEPQNPFDLSMRRENHDQIKRRFFRCAQVSLRLFLFNVICLKEHLELILENGTLPQEKLEVMREKIKEIKKVDSLAEFFRLVGDEGNEIERIRFAYINAKKCNYF